MTNDSAAFACVKKDILICDTQPVAVEGMKWLIENSGDMQVAGCVPTLEAVYSLLNPEAARAAKLAEKPAAELTVPESAAVDPVAVEDRVTPEMQLVAETVGEAEISPFSDAVEVGAGDHAAPPTHIDAVVIDKGLGLLCVMDLLQKLTSMSHPTPVVVWGAINEAEALRMLQAGARGVLRRTSESGTLLNCLRSVTAGNTWMEDGIFGSAERLFNPNRSQLTSREKEVVSLVEKGMRNRDIARTMGIQTGTVKIHLKHIFEKTGVRGRYSLAFTGLQSKGSIAVNAPPQFTA